MMLTPLPTLRDRRPIGFRRFRVVLLYRGTARRFGTFSVLARDRAYAESIAVKCWPEHDVHRSARP